MQPAARDLIDDRLIRGLHVEAVRHSGLHPEHEPHVVFQTSTLDALFEGDFDGDLTIQALRNTGGVTATLTAGGNGAAGYSGRG